MSKTGYKRVYESNGAFFYVDGARKWHRLCPVADGEPAMLRALAKVRSSLEPGRQGSMTGLIAAWRADKLPGYAESTRKDYAFMLAHVEAALRDFDVADITSHHVLDLRDQWLDKPRTANKYQALLSVLMSYAILKRLRTTNPCTEVKKLKVVVTRPAVSNAQLLGILDGVVTGKDGRRNGNGAMMACLIEFTYLTALRQKDVRLLQRSAIGEHEIVVQPSKTQGSSGAAISIAITPDIRDVLDRADALGKVKDAIYVFHKLRGGAFTASAVKSAWRRARERAGVQGVRYRDLRRKALSDAKRAGRTLEQLRDAAAHTSVATTEGYMTGFDVVDVNLGLTLPKRKESA